MAMMADRDRKVVTVSLLAARLDAAAVLAAVADSAAGGNVLFVGTVRDLTDGRFTVALEYEAHEPLARALLERLGAEAASRFGLTGVAIAHRLGRVEPGEASVVVAASSAHRREAFAATEWLMERIKRDVPIWKCELRPDGGREWVHDGGPAGGGRS